MPAITGCGFQCPIYDFKMPANFTSGWLGNGERAWHGQGVVTEGTLPAREAFETAKHYSLSKTRASNPDQLHKRPIGPTLQQAFGVVRTDTQALLGVVSKATRLSRTIRSFGWQSSSARG